MAGADLDPSEISPEDGRTRLLLDDALSFRSRFGGESDVGGLDPILRTGSGPP